MTTTTRKTSYTYEDLLLSGQGALFGEGSARLPKPNMLMFDRITDIRCTDEKSGAGIVRAELDIHPDLWFFGCHFQDDPVMPGCLGLDSLWQLTGFYLAWSGHLGKGRALGVGEVKFVGQILPTHKNVTYQIEVKRVIARKLVLAVADGTVTVDGKQVYTATGMKVGLFESTEGF
ncbi:MAG TPA: bifunctional 3-hydroxydecanoyl-ACP dehydratase/trans-2-decenoyl-ACP isomerase [Kiritimatiellia bacterium]|nr:bifunctional 3-hydroxydecanoyl-ACP dehydratase/trans-2-decenoyl-ACP isomerase [Kiritimatiellia bacterium]HMO99440.1 bifunctional 3-hydroxydecanoyl-ACP dehydratase/trans-2-decenoyl-ACP isomerase [Kiritimatiellia bacterium]HMP97381.1 bifunctional 3-hydroxydecanoyl-ACP dehydratase/trans-2-decenoyl-ACP isomerase [Kiritimatiellia bacterium]